MKHIVVTPEERYAALTETLLNHQDVTIGAAGRKGFGSSALCIRGKIFAMLSNGRLVVKLPRQRVDTLVAAGSGDRFDPRRDGRQMKEWLTVDSLSAEMWLPLAREALEFVAAAH